MARSTLAGEALEHPVEARAREMHGVEEIVVQLVAGVHVVGYSDEASGTMQLHQGKMRFTEVSLRPQVVIAAGSDPALAKRLHEQAHEHCFIASSVNFPVSCDARVSVADTK